MSPRIMLVEDHELLADSVAAALTAQGMDVSRPSSLDAPTVLAEARAWQPQVVLLDLRLQGDETTLPLISPLRELGSAVVMVTGETDRARLAECVEAGAIGLVPKSDSFERLVTAIVEATELRMLLTKAERDELLGELYRQRADDVERLRPFDRLTPRERVVLAGLIEGLQAEALAAEAFVSVATIRSQIRSVLSKLGVKSQLAAVALARAARWEP